MSWRFQTSRLYKDSVCRQIWTKKKKKERGLKEKLTKKNGKKKKKLQNLIPFLKKLKT